MTAISEARWQEAQKHEALYWEKEARDETKLMRDIEDGHRFTAALLNIHFESVYRATILDIAGGPHPLAGSTSHLSLGLKWYAVLDPAGYTPVDHDGPNYYIANKAEGWRSGTYDEVWGYNVLQHVVDPAEVMATARACALKTIRWFDVVDTPIYPVHPHSISADWLRGELTRDGFRLTRDIDGSRLVEGTRQKWVALVAERA